MRLLILGCSQKKHPRLSTMPAFQRYDGPIYRVFRKFLREQSAEGIDLYILSAAHGLLSGDLLIGNYDQRLTPERSIQLKPQVQELLTNICSHTPYSDILVVMGKDYRELVDGVMPDHTVFAEGGIGQKASALYHWLRK